MHLNMNPLPPSLPAWVASPTLQFSCAGEIPSTEPGRLQSGRKWVRYDLAFKQPPPQRRPHRKPACGAVMRGNDTMGIWACSSGTLLRASLAARDPAHPATRCMLDLAEWGRGMPGPEINKTQPRWAPPSRVARPLCAGLFLLARSCAILLCSQPLSQQFFFLCVERQCF